MDEIENTPEVSIKQKLIKGIKTIGRTTKNGLIKVGSTIKKDVKRTGEKIKQKWSDLKNAQETINDLRIENEKLKKQLSDS